MEFLGSGLLGVVFAGIAVSVITAVMPAGNSEKIMRITASVFMLAVMCAPIKELADADISDLFSDRESADTHVENMTEKIKDVCAQAIENSIGLALNSHGITEHEVSAELYYDAENYIIIQELKVILPSEFEEDAYELSEELTAATGVKTVVETR